MTSPDQPKAVPDEVIVSKLRAQDDSGLTQLLEKHGGRARWWLEQEFGGYCRGGEVDAALNEATLSVWNSIHTYQEDRGSLWAWFYRIARNAALNLLKQDSKHGQEALDLDSGMPEGAQVLGQSQWSAGEDAAEEVEEPNARQQEYLEALRQCIRALPDLQRRVIQADLQAPAGEIADTKELAKLYKTTVNSIKSSRSQGRKRIKEAMQARGFYLDEEEGGATT